ncbi:MAG: hypothetical protein PVH89_13880 [Gammaproteobacteria bacterium]
MQGCRIGKRSTQRTRVASFGVHTAISLAVLTAGPSLAQEPSAIEWSPSTRLAWSNFRGTVPSDTEDRRVAATAGSLTWSYEYTVQWSRARCRFRIDGITSQALFHPDRSWVRAGHDNDSVLQHEQGHFDILQLYKERFDARTREFVGDMRDCEGRSERRATRDTRDRIDRLVGSIYEETWRDYRSRQEAYDRETQHGIDRGAQSSWTQDLNARLRAEQGG